jgi:enterochelin esterase family protein
MAGFVLAVLGVLPQHQSPIRLEQRSYQSRIYAAAKRVWLYTPPAGPKANAPIAGLVICLWGDDYRDKIPVPQILDSLVNAGKLPRLAAVLLDDNEDRLQDFGTTRRAADTIASEVVPWVSARLGVTIEPRHTIVTGYSAAGNAAAYAAYAHPKEIGNVLTQSGAFWRGFEGEGGSEPDWVAGHFAAAEPTGTTFYIEVGGEETTTAAGVSLLEANRKVRDVLLKKGYSVTYEEVPGGRHEFGHWRSKFGDGLIALISRWGLTQ